MKRKIELMAPAGSRDSLMAAIQGGADSVYFGVEQLNMRARATMNFTLEDLEEVAELCRSNGVRSYITVNTILYDHDISIMKRIVDRAKEAGIDAIIASDQGAIGYARSVGLECHISTQVNISNVETLRFYSHFADVAVLARELSLRQMEDIVKVIEREQIKGPSGELMQVEVFAHGALCMAVSGKCYLSLHSHNSSANRGACIQNCRRTYTVIDKEEGVEMEIDNEFIMSPKDLCTVDFLDQLLNTGVSVLKIEGRGREPGYVKTVIECYREAIDAYLDGTYNEEKVAGWMARLEKVYNRGFWGGYYLGQKLGEWTDGPGSKATTKKVYLGKVNHYYPKAGVGEFKMETHAIKPGDNIMITGPTTGVVEMEVDELWVNEKPADQATKGDLFSMKIDRVRESDKLYKIVDVER